MTELSADHDWTELDGVTAECSDDLRAATSLFSRLVGYVDRGHL